MSFVVFRQARPVHADTFLEVRMCTLWWRTPVCLWAACMLCSLVLLKHLPPVCPNLPPPFHHLPCVNVYVCVCLLSSSQVLNGIELLLLTSDMHLIVYVACVCVCVCVTGA